MTVIKSSSQESELEERTDGRAAEGKESGSAAGRTGGGGMNDAQSRCRLHCEAVIRYGAGRQEAVLSKIIMGWDSFEFGASPPGHLPHCSSSTNPKQKMRGIHFRVFRRFLN